VDIALHVCLGPRWRALDGLTGMVLEATSDVVRVPVDPGGLRVVRVQALP